MEEKMTRSALRAAWTAAISKSALKKQPRIKNVRRKVVNGIEFASTKEARVWQDLCLQQQAKQIIGLRRQVPIDITINGIHVCDYVVDFFFLRDGKQVVMDAKGFRTEMFRIKKKLVRAVHGIEIEEV